MTPEQFVYWLNGFAELNPSLEQPTPEQWKSITEHLKTVFVKVTPEVKVAPLKIEWPVDAKPVYINEFMRKAIRDAQRSPYPGPLNDRLDLHGVQFTC